MVFQNIYDKVSKVVFLFICAWLIMGPEHLRDVGTFDQISTATQTNHCHSNSRIKLDLEAQALSQRALCPGYIYRLRRQTASALACL